MESKIEVIEGKEGYSIYINNFRVCGSKPWGGGKTIISLSAKTEDIEKSIKDKV